MEEVLGGRSCAAVVTVAVALVVTLGGQADPGAMHRHTLVHGGRERVYVVHLPENRKPSMPVPVVLVLHGGGGADAAEMARRTRMNRIADREGFVVVYPAGVDGQWNERRGASFRRGHDQADVDDVGFIRAVIDALVRDRVAHPEWVFVLGLSNGGMMAYRLGIELGDRLAAIAAVIANLPEALASRTPVRPLPVLVMNGTADPMMPWHGGPVRVLGRGFGQVLSTERTVRYWVDAAELPAEPVREVHGGRTGAEACAVEVRRYRRTERGPEVVLYAIGDGGHDLPGGDTPDRPRLLGRKCDTIDGTEVIWQFFARHGGTTRAMPVGHPAMPVRPTAAPVGVNPRTASRLSAGAATTDPPAWQPRVERVGDPDANYVNVEVTHDGRYLVWFEATGDSATDGLVWHCGVDPRSGRLEPPDCRGFLAFESTAWGRANPGHDVRGPYYVGADRDGCLILVRPTGPRTGEVTRLPTSSDPRRRAIYPTHLDDRAGGFVLMLRNERTPGPGVRPLNDWVELQYLDLAAPHAVRAIERQATPPVGLAPMDTGFVRWMRGRPLLAYGSRSTPAGRIDVRAFDADLPSRGPVTVVANGHDHVDPYPVVVGHHEYLFAGIDATATTHVYRRPAGGPADTPFELWRTLVPPASRLSQPGLAQSHEPFVFGGRLYSVYQVNDRGRDFFGTTFREPGELWLADVSQEPVRQWLIAPDAPGPVAEPEPLVSDECAWVFYSRPMLSEMSGGEAARAQAPSPASAQRADGSARPWRGRAGTGQSGPQGLPRLALYRADLPLCKRP